MSDEQPDAGVGRDIQAEVGYFNCPCGADVIKSVPYDEYVELTMASPEYPFTQETITCGECGREWALVDDGCHWEFRGGDPDE